MAITASQVKELRDKTGAGMMDCKKALKDSEGDFDKAVDILRKKGASVAAKRAERSANEGIIKTKVFNDAKSALMLQVNCETDFVAKSDDFMNFTEFVADTVLEKRPSDVDALMKESMNGKSVEDELNGVTAKIGEKIKVSRFILEELDNGFIVDYVHHGSKLGVLLLADNVKDEHKDELSAIMRDIAMQVAAMKPAYTKREDVPEDVVNHELEIYKDTAKQEGKPEHILDKIAQGKLNKFYQENCLTEQEFVKDNNKVVGDLIKEFNEKNSAEVNLLRFQRFHVSE
jgi:elongation factor Ts